MNIHMDGGGAPGFEHVATYDNRDAWQDRSTWLRFTGTPVEFSGQAVETPYHGDSQVYQILEVGVLCEFVAGPAREKCDHVLATVQAINNKEDGFLDNLLPGVRIRMATQLSGCVQGLTDDSMAELFKQLPNMLAVIGPPCSDDVAAASTWLQANNKSATIISPESSAPQLDDETAFPNVARYVTNGHTFQSGMVELMMHYGWKRIGVLNDESVWSSGVKDSFISQLKGRCPSCSITNEGDTDLNTTLFSLGNRTVRDSLAGDLLRRLNDTDTRITYVITQSEIQRDLYAAIYRTKMMYGKGFAWFSGWMPEAIVLRDGEVDLEAARGAEGVLGWIDAKGKPTAITSTYKSTYRLHASRQACERQQKFTAHVPIADTVCDKDDLPTSIDGQGPVRADAITAVANVCDTIIRTRGMDAVTPSAVYEGLLRLAPFDGVNGRGIKLNPNTGDKLGLLSLQNVQLLFSNRDRRTGVMMEMETVQFMQVGSFDSSKTPASDGLFLHCNRASTDICAQDDYNAVVFPGKETRPPLDGSVMINHTTLSAVITSNAGVDPETVAIVIVVSVALVAILSVAVTIAVEKRQAIHAANTPVCFEEYQRRLAEAGMIDDSEDAVFLKPRELRRAWIDLDNILDSGNFGEVWKATLDDDNQPGYMVAAKTLIESKSDNMQQLRDDLLQEAFIMAQVGNHPNLMSLVGIVTRGLPTILVVSFCEHGSLLSKLKKRAAVGEPFDLKEKVRFGHEISTGMAHLVTRNIVHRDLAARNVLLATGFKCKVADFGLSRNILNDENEHEYYRSSGGCVPIRWTAPEGLLDCKFSSASDVWSFGMVMIEILQDGKVPYCGVTSNLAVMTMVQDREVPDRPEECPDFLYELLVETWVYEPESRPKFLELSAQFDVMQTMHGDDIVKQDTKRRSARPLQQDTQLPDYAHEITGDIDRNSSSSSTAVTYNNNAQSSANEPQEAYTVLSDTMMTNETAMQEVQSMHFERQASLPLPRSSDTHGAPTYGQPQNLASLTSNGSFIDKNGNFRKGHPVATEHPLYGPSQKINSHNLEPSSVNNSFNAPSTGFLIEQSRQNDAAQDAAWENPQSSSVHGNSGSVLAFDRSKDATSKQAPNGQETPSAVAPLVMVNNDVYIPNKEQDSEPSGTDEPALHHGSFSADDSGKIKAGKTPMATLAAQNVIMQRAKNKFLAKIAARTRAKKEQQQAEAAEKKRRGTKRTPISSRLLALLELGSPAANATDVDSSTASKFPTGPVPTQAQLSDPLLQSDTSNTHADAASKTLLHTGPVLRSNTGSGRANVFPTTSHPNATKSSARNVPINNATPFGDPNYWRGQGAAGTQDQPVPRTSLVYGVTAPAASNTPPPLIKAQSSVGVKYFRTMSDHVRGEETLVPVTGRSQASDVRVDLAVFKTVSQL